MTICIFGDSITWGAYDPKYGGWATRLRNYFESADSPPYFREAGDVDVYNLGIPGDTTAGLLNRIEVEAKSREPNLIMFAIGINDAQFIQSVNSLRTPLDAFQGNLSKLLAVAKEFTDKIIFVGLTAVDESKTSPVPWSTDRSYTNKNIRRLNDTIEKFCEEKGLTFIPMNDVLENKDLFDGLHPNTYGHEKMFERIRKALDSLVQEK